MTSPETTIQLLHDLVAIPSISRDEDTIATFLHDWLGNAGVTVERWGNNLISTIEGAEPGPTFLLNSHMDTVPAGEGWDTDPWTPTVKDGRLIGLGSGDAKASLTAMACATARLQATGLPRGKLIFAATCQEEITPSGLEQIRPDLGHIDAALVGEPTSLQGALAQGGLLLLEATAHGVASHAARAHLGVNALTVAARDLIAIDALKLDRIHPFMGESTVNVTVIQGGSRHNVIPDRCGYTLDIRYNSAYTHDEIIAIIDDCTAAELRIRSSRLQPVETSPEAPIAHALRAAHPEVTFFGSPTLSDWVFLKGIDAVKIGPGDSERSHTANESVALHELTAAVSIYEGCARNFLA